MKRLLNQQNLELLAQLAWSKVLLAFDFDGTLAPIVGDRTRAFMRSSTSRRFSRLCELYPCAVISGRSKADIGGRLDDASVKYIVGNHGLEPGTGLSRYEREVDVALPLLERTLRSVSGIDIENKQYSLAIHYRRSRGKRRARAAIQRAVMGLPVKMRLVPGKQVLNVIPERAPNKGDALLRLREIEGADIAFYAGDDVTDEDVFELDQPGRLITVRIGQSSTSAASYFLRNQAEIDALLSKLISLRALRGEAAAP